LGQIPVPAAEGMVTPLTLAGARRGLSPGG
jgi:hypothetical protein